MDIYQAMVKSVARRKILDWDEAVATLNMVYGWMPTMLRNIGMRAPSERKRLVATLAKARTGSELTTDELTDVQQFSNRSIVGASKLLHVISPDCYPIWDSRVAKAFLWERVSQGTFSQLQRYVEYMGILSVWSTIPEVISECSNLRKLNATLSEAGDLRLIELVLYRSMK